MTVIGLDFDNTIACYDTVFHTAAVDAGMVTNDWSGSRQALRRCIREIHGDRAWSMLQARAYGPGLRRADAFPGAVDCIRFLLQRGHDVAIVSHKSRVAAADPSADLHLHAWQWLERHGLLATPPRGVRRERVFFEQTRDEKVARIIELQCSHFVDDLPEVFDHPAFPPSTVQVLFNPEQEQANHDGRVSLRSWNAIREFFMDAGTVADLRGTSG
jgi:hypothetical protein